MSLRAGPSGPSIGTVDVALQDQSTPSIQRHFFRVLSEHVLLADAVPNTYTIRVAGVAPGDLLWAWDELDRYEVGTAVGVAGNIVTLDRPVDRPFTQNQRVTVVDIDLAIDGSTTPVTYTLELPETSTKQLDLTTIFVSMVCATQPDDSKFGDQSALTNGVLLRAVYDDGVTVAYTNLFNAKDNGELKEAMSVWEYSDKAGGGAYAFDTYAVLGGQGGYGVVIRMTAFLRLELIVQDDLSGLNSVHVIARGHTVEP